MDVVSIFPTPILLSDEYPTNLAEGGAIRDQVWRHNPQGGNESSENNYVLELPELGQLKAFLQSQVDFFAHDVLKVNRSTPLHITQSWVNVNIRGAAHHLHSHQNSLISGVFFLDGDTAPIVFSRPHANLLFGSIKLELTEMNAITAGEVAFPDRPNRAMLFPSPTLHFVKENRSDAPRMTLAFNTFARGTLGLATGLTELRL